MKQTSRFTVGTDYAVTYMDGLSTPMRPLRAVWNGEAMEVHDPDDPLDFPVKVGLAHLAVLGEWTGRTHPTSARNQTWAQYAAEQYGHVLRQRLLVERLAKVGIKRDPEPYVHKDRISNSVELSLTLNYDELDLLLRRGGV